MLVPTPRKIKERRKNAASTMATSFIQKLILSRFIIMAGYPPRFSGTETIVYHVAADYGNRDSPPGSGLEDLPLGISTVERRLDYCEIGPFPRLQRPRLGLDTERARPPERRQLETSHATHTMHLHREQRLLEKVHARTAPEPVSTHTDPDAGGDHAKHGRDAAPEEVIRTGTMRRRYAGLDQNPYVLFGESAGPTLYELDLLGALGEMDRERPPHLARPLCRQMRGLGVYGIRGMHAYPGIHALRQTFTEFARLRDYELDGLLRGADLVREELSVDGPRHPARGELRQALSVRG